MLPLAAFVFLCGFFVVVEGRICWVFCGNGVLCVVFCGQQAVKSVASVVSGWAILAVIAGDRGRARMKA